MVSEICLATRQAFAARTRKSRLCVSSRDGALSFDLPMARAGWTLKRRRAWCRARHNLLLGFGLAVYTVCLIPLMGFLILPVAVTVAVRMPVIMAVIVVVCMPVVVIVMTAAFLAMSVVMAVRVRLQHSGFLRLQRE